MIGSYERKNLTLPKEFNSSFGKEFIFATSSIRKEKCFILIKPNLVKRNNLSDYCFWGGVKVSNNGDIKIPRWILEKLPPEIKVKKEDAVVIVGCIDRIEIWKKENWQEYEKEHDFQESLEKLFSE